MGKKTIHGVVIREVNTRRSNGNLSILSSQFKTVVKRRMVDEEQCSNEVLTWPDICFMESSQTPITVREDDVKDVDDDDIGEEMNKKFLLRIWA